MKYGLYYYKNTKVLGDDFWAYAQSLFYPHIDYLIDNTTIYKFKSKNDEMVATIMSAFIEPMNHEWGFLPPSNILPLFVGSYFRSTMWEYLENSIVQEYLRANAPIGVRSRGNVERLKECNIKAFFSGCITLTLPQMEKTSGNYICCVDVPDYVIDYVKKTVGDRFEIKVLTHKIWQWNEEEQREHENASIDDRFKKVVRFLQIYANAHCVITSRLHCALPCLTQHTPVLLTVPKDGEGIVDMNDRMGDFFELFHMQYYEDFLSDSITYDFISPPANSDNWKKYRDDVDNYVRDFIERCEHGNAQINPVYTETERLEQLTDILETKVIQLKKVVDDKNRYIRKLTSGTKN